MLLKLILQIWLSTHKVNPQLPRDSESGGSGSIWLIIVIDKYTGSRVVQQRKIKLHCGKIMKWSESNTAAADKSAVWLWMCVRGEAL